MEIPWLSPRGQSQHSRMGWEMWVGDHARRLSLIACSPAPAHPKMAVPVCWSADGTAGGMRGSSGWEMARGAARMIHGNTEGQSGSGKGKGRERGNKKSNSLLFWRNLPQKAIITEVLHEMVLRCARDGSQVPRVQGHRAPTSPSG